MQNPIQGRFQRQETVFIDESISGDRKTQSLLRGQKTASKWMSNLQPYIAPTTKENIPPCPPVSLSGELENEGAGEGVCLQSGLRDHPAATTD